MKIPKNMLFEAKNRDSEPLYTLPSRALAIGWLISESIAVGIWPLIGALLAATIGGLGLIALMPWKPRRSGDLPTYWLAATTGRLLLIPGVAFLLYSATQPPDKPYVLGLAVASLALLMVEVPLIAKAMLRQITLEESAARASEASESSDG
jgi:hypothetical protein